MAHKKQDSILGLAPLPPQQENSNLVFYDPFAGIYHRLTKDEQRVVDIWRKQALVIRAQQLKAVLAGRAIGELHEEITEEFTLTALALDPFTVIAQGTASAKYVEEFVHRQKQLLARDLEDTVGIAVDTIKASVGQSLAAVLANPQERRNFLQRLAYLIKGE
jgi:hypothetical protein